MANRYGALSDEQLIERLRAGETEIMDLIMVKYKPVVLKKARAMYLLGGENEDLIQEGMIGLIKAVRSYDPAQKTSFAGFAELCISRQMYTAIEASRRKKHMPLNSYISIYEEDGEEKGALIDTIGSDVDNDPEALFFGREFLEAFTAKLTEALSPLENRVLYLHLMGTDYKKIAELLGKTPKTVDNALQRIKAKADRLIRSEKAL